MKYLHFQQSNTEPMGKQPWSVVVAENGDIIHGRPDADYLIGFGPIDSYEITVLKTAFFEDPDSALGLAPRFQKSGDMFSVDLPVAKVDTYEATEDTITRLREREAVMREAFENS